MSLQSHVSNRYLIGLIYQLNISCSYMLSMMGCGLRPNVNKISCNKTIRYFAHIKIMHMIFNLVVFIFQKKNTNGLLMWTINVDSSYLIPDDWGKNIVSLPNGPFLTLKCLNYFNTKFGDWLHGCWT